jgi:hypothetical protein
LKIVGDISAAWRVSHPPKRQQDPMFKQGGTFLWQNVDVKQLLQKDAEELLAKLEKQLQDDADAELLFN